MIKSRHYWAIHELEKKVGIIKGVLPIKNGIHLFLVHNRYINENESPSGFRELHQLIAKSVPDLQIIDSRQILNNSKPLKTQLSFINFDLATEYEKIIPFFAGLRAKVFDEETFSDKALILIAPFWTWDIIHDRRILSVVNYHKYLCWDGKKLLDKDEHKGTDCEFFQGAAFHAATERDRYPELDQYNIGELKNDYERAIQWLEKQNSRLDQLGKSGQVNLTAPKLGYHYLHVLASFLPPFSWQKDGKKHWIPSNPGNWGGPVKWTSIWTLDMHTRHLLLDGWLSLWNDKKTGELLLQPASISLLYWVACYTKRPHTESIQAFLDNYDWNRTRWFGGRWDRGR